MNKKSKKVKNEKIEKEKETVSNNLVSDLNLLLKSGLNVLLIGKPGTGKTAIVESLAKENGWHFYDFRLSQLAPEDFLGIPSPDKENKIVELYPRKEWVEIDSFLKRNEPVLLFFDEINRARQEIVNTCLGLINEKRIAHFNWRGKPLYIVSAANQGEEDGTIVEEWDTAVLNRFVVINHNPTLSEWIQWAEKNNINKKIISFLKEKPEFFLTSSNITSDGIYISPRTWGYVSNLLNTIEANKDNNLNNEESLKCLKYLIGNVFVDFKIYLDKIMKITPMDVLDNYSKVKETIKMLSREEKNELYFSLKNYISNIRLTKEQTNNIIDFISNLDDDIIIAAVKEIDSNISLIEGFKNTSNERIKKIILSHLI